MEAPQRLDARLGNRILQSLAAHQREQLHAQLEPIELRLGEVLARPGDHLSYVYFPETSIVSLLGATRDGSTIEVAFTGYEGVAGVLALLGTVTTPYAMVVNLPGRALRAPTDAARDAILAEGRLPAIVGRSLRLLVLQITQSAVCNRFHSPRQRLARWLALASDRVGRDMFPMTHETMASMVGGARSMVSQACSELRERGAIEYRRGSLRVLDPALLHAEACECYAAVTQAVAEVVPAPA